MDCLQNAAILFEPDGYVLGGDRLMGRQAAGNAFLRAAVAGRGGEAMWAYTPFRRSAEIFAQVVQGLDPAAEARWAPADRLDILTGLGTLYLPGPGLDAAARLRLRVGPGAYSLCGVTHTTASHGAMDAMVGMLAAPVMPWDALICTSTAVLATVRLLLDAEREYLGWRFGAPPPLTLPQLPVIPLGVHCADFEIGAAERQAARQALAIGEDEVVALFVGRLSFHAKAHPHAMYRGLQAAATRTGKRLVLIQCGWFANTHIEQAFKTGAAAACPEVRSLFADGKDQDARRQAWAAADLFVSLSDNIQETFGLTPIEAMAAGLPVVVADWDGYKDTVRDGMDGFRISTCMPPPDLGESLARSHEAGVDNYDFYCGLTCQTVSVDQRVLSDRLSDLVGNEALRRRLGEAGRQRARQVYDWQVIYGLYQQLWGELARLRRDATGHAEWQARLAGAPRAAASRMDPFRSFGHYPTALIQPATLAELLPGSDGRSYRALAGHPLFGYADKMLPSQELVEGLLAGLSGGGLPLRALAERVGVDLGRVVLAMAVLAKMGLVRLSSGGAGVAG